VVVATGRIQPLRQVNISPEVGGELIELPVQEGQQVKQGDLLFKIKPDFYIASRDQADGNYKSAQAGIDIANATLQHAEAELKRNQELYHNKLISESAFSEVKTACDIARAQLHNAEGQLEVARAALAKAQLNLDETKVFSPITGTITRLCSAVGERVAGTTTAAGTEIMSIANLNEMEARVKVRESEIGQITCGQTAQLEADAFEGQSFVGKVIGIATSPNSLSLPHNDGSQESTGFEVKIRINEKQAFRPGISVTARMQTSSQFGAFLAPVPRSETTVNLRPVARRRSADNSQPRHARTASGWMKPPA
jgi:HlyD family secretion protein